MSRETELYRPQLERVLTQFPNKELIPVKEAAEWLGGIDSRRLYISKGSPAKRIGGRYYVTPISLSRWLAQQ